MTIEQAAKVLVEEMGMVWHKIDAGPHRGLEMPIEITKNGDWCEIKPLDFQSWDFFGKVWEWAKKQEWWILFLSNVNGYISDHACEHDVLYHMPIEFIGPKLITELAEFVVERREENK